MLGALGIGLVCGWLVSGFDPRPGRRAAVASILTAVMLCFGAAMYVWSGFEGLLSFAISSGAATLVRLLILRSLARRSAA